MLTSNSIRRTLRVAAFAGASMLTAALAHANVSLPAIFSDHMVLQQGIAVPVWGTASAGEEVTVTFGAQKQTAKADGEGHWEVKLEPLVASNKPEELSVAGSNKVEFKDVLVGEVWVCSGQSNMEFGMRSVRNHDEEIKAANFPEIRLFTVQKDIQPKPIFDIPEAQRANTHWEACTPEDVAGFTAVGYFFGRDLYQQLKVPVGLIHTSWGGTPAEAWTAHSYLEQDSDLRPSLERFDQDVASYPQRKAKYEETEPAVMKKWEEEAAKAKEEKKTPPRKPAGPTDPARSPNAPSVLYNGMVSPILPYAIKGAIWYQGESNAGRAYQYRKLLPAMIKSWRDAWHEPEFDFYIVSLANFQARPKEPGDSTWAELREAQAMTAAQPHNGEALAIDLANADHPENIHPTNKQDVGYRLSLVALAKTYGEHVEYSGPEYENSKIDGDKVILNFKFHNGLEALGGEPLKGFQIAGEDKKWHWADAKIEGDTVVVSSADVKKPEAVRYDWANNPEGNLYNAAKLPAVPFRTDDWKGITADAK